MVPIVQFSFASTQIKKDAAAGEYPGFRSVDLSALVQVYPIALGAIT
jgi:hypothetical protein